MPRGLGQQREPKRKATRLALVAERPPGRLGLTSGGTTSRRTGACATRTRKSTRARARASRSRPASPRSSAQSRAPPLCLVPVPAVGLALVHVTTEGGRGRTECARRRPRRAGSLPGGRRAGVKTRRAAGPRELPEQTATPDRNGLRAWFTGSCLGQGCRGLRAWFLPGPTGAEVKREYAHECQVEWPCKVPPPKPVIVPKWFKSPLAWPGSPGWAARAQPGARSAL